MRRQTIWIDRVTIGRLASTVLVAATFGARAEIEERDQPPVPEIVPLEIFATRVYLAPQGAFPMLSDDGEEVAILYGGLYFDGDRSIALDFMEVPGSRPRHRHLLQHEHEDFAGGLSDGRIVRDRITIANTYLSERGFGPMNPFFRLAYDPSPSEWPEACYPQLGCEFYSQSPGDQERLPAQANAEGRRVRFDYQTGMLTIGDTGSAQDDSFGRNDLVLHWPVTEMRSSRGDTEHQCQVQASPREAWISGTPRNDGKRVLVLRISWLVDDLACTQPDEWSVQLLPG